MKQMTGAEVLVKSLEDLGVKRTFGYIGGAIMPVYDALARSNIDITINSNEQCAGFSAAAYSRSSDDVGVVIVTSGPGITNALTPVGDSYTDSVPLLVFAGQVPEHKMGTDSFQHAPVIKVFDPVAKSVILLQNGNLEAIIKDSYYLAKMGKPGPIVIDLPKDKQVASSSYQNIDATRFKEKYTVSSHLCEDQCKSFFDLLLSSEKPLLYIGGGLNSKKASAAIRELNSMFQIPVVNTLMAKGVFDGNDSLSMGMLGMHGTPYANMVVQETDCFLVFGARWDDRVAEKVGIFGPQAKVAYIDINEEKVQKIREERNADFTFVGEITNALETLIDYAKANALKTDFEDWRQRALHLKKSYPLNYDRDSKFIQAAAVMELLNKHIDENTKITTGVGVHQMLAAQYLNMPCPKSFLTSGSFGTMGFSMPAAVGAAFASPEATIISVDGDGGFKMNEGELNTIMEYNLPIKIIVLNNKGDGMVKNWQNAFYKETGYVATERSYDTKFSDIAKAHGFPWTMRINQKALLEQSLNDFIAQEGPALLEVITDPDEAVYPRIFPGKTYAQMELGPFITESK